MWGRFDHTGEPASKVLLPGYGHTGKAAAAASLCPVGTWSTGLRSSLTPCQRCPAGLTTAREGAVSRDECRAGPGLYLQEGVRVCPPGTYQPDYHLQGSEACKPCAPGVTTAGSAAVAAAECAFAQPGYGLTTCDNSSGCQAQVCAVGWYNLGGLKGSNSCQVCPWVVPPGYGVVYPLPADAAVSAVQLCSSGYNPGWNRQGCTPCGANIASRSNRTSAWDCFVLKGQGLQMLPSSSAAGNAPTRGAVDCWPGSVGMAVDTVIFNARPCDTCPRFMTTEQPLSSSKSDCKALPGYIPVAVCLPGFGGWSPAASDIDCPNSWDVLAPGSNYGLPPACVPPSGKCATAIGQFWDNDEVEEIEVDAAGKKGVACACKQARSKGHILKWVDAIGRPDPQKGRLGCVPIAAFLPASAALPTGPGVWVVDDVATATCWDAPSCWDMCFFCDGSRRYSAQTPSAQRPGSRTARTITGTCDSISCPLGPAVVQQRSFFDACERYAGTATREARGNLALVSGAWPFRPVQSAPTVLRLAANLTVPLSANQGQEVLQSWLWPAGSL
ncbi:hypothetical protein COO60DRAFT_1641974 [Scenedesmus sp. NREL 46B-D3]|nr:hypothetical protein COO60DRAFT_1641974 [Scenedesmus sp. NREL 46B-D3]